MADVLPVLRFCLSLCALVGAAAHAQEKAEPIRLAMIEGFSGPFANAGASWLRNLRFAVDAVNARGGVRLTDAAGRTVRRPLSIETFDGKGQVEDSLVALRAAQDRDIGFVLQGASSSVAGALVDAIARNNQRHPERRMVFLNYAAVAPELTNGKCSFWHFRFDIHAGMRMFALTEALKADAQVHRVWLINQDYGFGHDVAALARQQIASKRPDVVIVGEDLHPIGRIKDFTPYVQKMIAAQADAVVTGNWGADLALLVKAARDAGLGVKFYTFYGNGLGAPAGIGDAGVGRVLAVAEWHPNAGGKDGNAYVEAYRATLSSPRDSYQHLRTTILVDMLASAIERANSTDPLAVARALEGTQWRNGFHAATMRAADHQLQQPVYVTIMGRRGEPGIEYDDEGSGFGFRTERLLSAAQAEQPTTCAMQRP